MALTDESTRDQYVQPMGHLDVEVLTGPISDALRGELTHCWMDVANSGGAVGFPFILVSEADVARALDALATDIERGDVVLVQARRLGTLVGWVTLRLNPSRLTSHWATIERLQSHPSQRGTGVGVALLQRATDHARNAGLEQLRLFLRGGMGLEEFYQRQGWVEIGRHRDALRFPDGDRDEVSMAIGLRSNLIDPIAEAG